MFLAKGSFPGLALYSGPTPDPWSCPGARSQLWLGFLRRRRSRATKASRSVPDHSSVQSAASLPQILGVLTNLGVVHHRLGALTWTVVREENVCQLPEGEWLVTPWLLCSSKSAMLTDGGWRPHTDGTFGPSKVLPMSHIPDPSQPLCDRLAGPNLPRYPFITSGPEGLD